ncbi:hypothetical protein [Arthrobacter sp. KK5.5]|uniref:hypothetical protein n=1 Tax=Arthrobacter sp. KK5.5 TaxID=3373084 RepID=UPI003EE45C54
MTQGLWTFQGVCTALILIFLQILTWYFASNKFGSKVGIPIVVALISSWVWILVKVANGFQLDDDELVWHLRGVEALSYLNGSLTTTLGDFGGKDGYVWLLGCLYYVAGPTPLVPILLNVWLFAWLQVLIMKLSKPMIPAVAVGTHARRATIMTLAFISASPVVVFWVPTVLREVICWFLILAAVHGAMRACLEHRLRHLWMTGLSVALLYWFRDTVGTGVGLALVAGVLFAWPRSSWRRAFRFVFTLVAVGGLMPVWAYMNERFAISGDEITGQNESLARDASTAIALNSTSGTSLYLELLARAIGGPFPWEWNASGGMILSVLGLVVWLVVLVLTLRYRIPRSRGSRRNDAVQVVAILGFVALVLVMMVAMTAGNYGIVTRFRMMPTMVLAPLAIAGLASLLTARSNRKGSGIKAPRSSHQIRDT